MSLADRFNKIQPPNFDCKICEWIVTQPSEDQEWFATMGEANKRLLLEACTAAGLDAGITTLRNHFNRNHQP